MFKYLTYVKEDNIGILTFNRPEARNALSNAMVKELEQALTLIEEDKELRALIITGAGDKAFMAGADIKELADRDFKLGREQTCRRQEVMNRLEKLPIPVIAAINGYALGAGLEIALACTLRVGAENARFASPEVNLGIIPGDGATQRLPRLIGKGRAMEMVLTGEPIDAQKAYEIGLINRVVPLADLMNATRQLAVKIISKAPLAIQYGKEAVNAALEMSLAEGLVYESYLHALCCATEDKKEGVTAFLEKRIVKFKGR